MLCTLNTHQWHYLELYHFDTSKVTNCQSDIIIIFTIKIKASQIATIKIIQFRNDVASAAKHTTILRVDLINVQGKREEFSEFKQNLETF